MVSRFWCTRAGNDLSYSKECVGKAPRNFAWQSDSDSSVDGCFQHASTVPEPDAGISYSFDAPRGPHQGSQILGMALAKAVEKFEVKATEKLIKDEYEVVGKEKEDADGCIACEDDYELV
jgi:hypothetical protein